MQPIEHTHSIMGMEIERKFLVKNDQFKQEAALAKGTTGEAGTYYRQGYIPTLNGMTVRIRIAGEQGYITMKDRAVGFSRHEFEYKIPKEEANQMLELMCSKPQIEKFRYIVPSGELKWEIDVFLGENKGLVVAEIEVPSEDTKIDLPDWIGEEVTGDKRYYNSHLIGNPFSKW